MRHRIDRFGEWLWRRNLMPNWYDDHFAYKLVCVAFGCVPIRDQCGIPDHDYCAWCGKSTPNEATL